MTRRRGMPAKKGQEMRIAKGLAAIVVVVASLTSGGSTVAAQGVSAEWKAYVEYVNTVAKATKLEDLYQHMAAPQLDFFKSFNKSDAPKVLQGMKDTMTRLGAFSGTMRLVREDVEPTARYLILEATTPDNKTVQGRVKMIREAGWVKLASIPDDEDWHEVKKK
jgi:hypothetical protein